LFNAQLLGWLLKQVSGIFVVEYNGHCVTWDCEKRLIMDTDKRFPCPLAIDEETLTLLGIERLEKVYKIIPRQQKNKKGRKRKAR
jgi:hypothetical protein